MHVKTLCHAFTQTRLACHASVRINKIWRSQARPHDAVIKPRDAGSVHPFSIKNPSRISTGGLYARFNDLLGPCSLNHREKKEFLDVAWRDASPRDRAKFSNMDR